MDQLPTISPNEVVTKRCIGKGHFSRVYYATLKRSGYENVDSIQKVAMKKPNTSEQLKQIKVEAKLMTQLNHKNILKLHSSIWSRTVPNTLYLLTELCNEGNLKTALSTPHNQATLLRIAFDVAEGLQYLKLNRVVHRDLAPRNILLHNGIAKIGDFGLSRKLSRGSNHYLIKRTDKLPHDVRAPENLEWHNAQGIHNYKSDVWAYGFCLYAIYNNGVGPWDTWPKIEFLAFIAEAILVREMPHQILDIVRRCFVFQAPQRNLYGLYEHQEQVDRISIEEICKMLLSLQDDMHDSVINES